MMFPEPERCRICVVDAAPGAEHPPHRCSLCFDKSWFLIFCNDLHCEEKLLWWGPSALFTPENFQLASADETVFLCLGLGYLYPGWSFLLLPNNLCATWLHFYGQLNSTLHCVYVQYCHYPFVSWQTFRLFPLSSYCEWSIEQPLNVTEQVSVE